MARLLIIHHTVSPSMHTLFRSVHDGATAEGVEGVEVVERPALVAGPADVLDADAYVVGCPANLGYMAGALKHFFDTIYYPCLESTKRRPYAVYVHGNDDVAGALAGIEKITAGLGWRLVQQPVVVLGEPGAPERDRCWELGAATAAGLMD